MHRVLIAEDEKNIRSIIRDYLINEGLEVEEACNGKEALDKYREGTYDLVILDVMMPYIDGWTVCQEIKKSSNTPVIFLTAREKEEDEIKGLSLMAEDYIKKPFSPTVLVMRIKRLLQIQTTEENKQVIIKGSLKIYKESMKVRVEDQEVELTVKAFQILCYLVENEGVVLSRDQILDYAWGHNAVADIRSVDTHIKKIRKALGEHAYMIRTVFGMGYKFEVV